MGVSGTQKCQGAMVAREIIKVEIAALAKGDWMGGPNTIDGNDVNIMRVCGQG